MDVIAFTLLVTSCAVFGAILATTIDREVSVVELNRQLTACPDAERVVMSHKDYVTITPCNGATLKFKVVEK